MIGMLWFDKSERPLEEKVRRAAAYHVRKYGQPAQVCLVNPADLQGEAIESVDGISVRGYHATLPGHLWIGTEQGMTELTVSPEEADA